ncbi:HAMP domain-containing sensor histidine kinase [Paenibacillus sp. BSR1-1]|uniref:sensor histidine kinase n=1 Tax=Paenibacillus sp. BSR1-1 TaxID=3020845 RepID=UPI0025B140A5|nr:HAMP domain-containing sensor histidine kinase [Paenibacillus sp. BSR1-1]MDN3017882.1 HAMP domain-containing sensor histidine kinase [Paenibacillus sp. BSR1-1]
MSRLKLGTKLLFTYFLLIIIIFIITSVSFRFISQRYLIHETEQQLHKEATVMSQLLGKSSLSRPVIEEKLMNRKALAVTERLLSSKMIIWTARQEIVYTDLKEAVLEEFRQRPRRNFVSETVPIHAKNGKTRGYVTLVARLDEVQELNRLMRRSQLISLVLSAMIAVVLGLFFKKGITRPIRNLSEHMKNYSLKGANREIRLTTKDEIGELAESFNALSRRLKQYDEDQKVFFQNASHELKTPLMAIQGNAEGILDGIVTGADVNKSLNVIIAESQRLKRIVEGITYLAKLESVEESFVFKRESLETILQEAVESVAALADQREIEIVVERAISEPLMVDREKMKRAFINLLGNAIRYAKSAVIVKSSIWDGKTFLIEVMDNGIGFAPGEVDKVFQRFYSGEEGGSGIGLAITKAIIEAHGGTIKALNGVQGGAVFQIWLRKL